MRNRYPGICYQCGDQVEKGQGHFELIPKIKTFRVQHAQCCLIARGIKEDIKNLSESTDINQKTERRNKMISISESANTIEELRQKVAASLGIQLELGVDKNANQTELELPLQSSLPQTSPAAPLAALANVNQKPVRNRRTAAQIEADRVSANKGAPAKEIIENNFKAEDAKSELVLDESLPNLLGDEVVAVPTPSAVHVQRTMLECQTLMKQIIGPKQEGMTVGIGLLKQFAPKAKVSELDNNQLNEFYYKAIALVKV